MTSLAGINEFRLIVSNRVRELLLSGRPPWRPENQSILPTNPLTKQEYSGINSVLLNTVAIERGYQSPYWATYKQWAKLGCQVKSHDGDGEWGVLVAQWMPSKKITTTPTSAKLEKFSRFNTTPLFNAEQVYGRDSKNYREFLISESADYSVVDDFITNTGIEISWGADRPRYERPPADRICLPNRETFRDDRQFYATFFHEAIHFCEWRTGWEGDEIDGEFVADIGMGILQQRFGLPPCDDFSDFLTYRDEWAKRISDDPKWLFTATTQAWKSIDLLDDLAEIRPESLP